MNSSVSTNGRGGLLPVASLLVSASLWGVLWYPLRLLESQGLEGLWSTLIIYSAAFFPSLLWFRSHLGLVKQISGSFFLLLLVAGWTNVAFILAVLEGNVVRVVLLFYLSPVWTVLLGRVFLHEVLDTAAWLVLIVAMCGALLILWPSDGVMGETLGLADLLAITSGMAFAATNVMVRRMGDIPVVIKMTSSWTGVLLISGAGLLLYQPALPEVGFEVYLAAIALGWFGIVLMTLTAQYGVTHMPVHRSAVIMLFEVLVAALSAGYLSDERMSLLEWCGGSLVVLAACYSAYASARNCAV